MVRAVLTLLTVLTRAAGLVLVVVGLVALATGPPRAGADGVSVQYQPPVTAPIVDHFRPPDHPYGPGNRGIDYATAAGTPVRASAPGVVTFAGAVGGRLVVVIVHADTLRTTYDGLATIAVTDAQTVAGGDTVGTAGTRLHFGVRDGTTYLDPELLFAAAGHAADVGVVARLVPTSGAPAAPTTRRGQGAARAVAATNDTSRRPRDDLWSAGAGRGAVGYDVPPV